MQRYYCFFQFLFLFQLNGLSSLLAQFCIVFFNKLMDNEIVQRKLIFVHCKKRLFRHKISILLCSLPRMSPYNYATSTFIVWPKRKNKWEETILFSSHNPSQIFKKKVQHMNKIIYSTPMIAKTRENISKKSDRQRFRKLT